MLDNIYSFIMYSPPETAAVTLVSILVGLSFSMIPIMRNSSKWIISLVWITTSLGFFSLAANNLGETKKATIVAKKEMCDHLGKYFDTRLNQSNYNCIIYFDKSPAGTWSQRIVIRDYDVSSTNKELNITDEEDK